MKIFLTGATGVIGRRVIPLCVQRGDRVTAVVRSPEGVAAVERLGAQAVVVDLFDRDRLAAAMPGHDVVVNLATHMPASSLRALLPGAWRENDRIRREGSATVAAAAVSANVPRLVQESYALVYPDHGDTWIDEMMPIAPAHYNRSIADAEHSAASFSRAGRIGIVLRFAAFYGPDGRFFADMVGAVRRGLAPLFGRPEAYLSCVSHDDAAAAVVAALELPAGIYNVTDDEPLTHRDLVDSLADALNVAPPHFFPASLSFLLVSPARNMTRSQRLSNRKLEDACSWRPRFRSVREGFPSAVAPFIRSSDEMHAPPTAHGV